MSRLKGQADLFQVISSIFLAFLAGFGIVVGGSKDGNLNCTNCLIMQSNQTEFNDITTDGTYHWMRVYIDLNNRLSISSDKTCFSTLKDTINSVEIHKINTMQKFDVSDNQTEDVLENYTQSSKDENGKTITEIEERRIPHDVTYTITKILYTYEPKSGFFGDGDYLLKINYLYDRDNIKMDVCGKDIRPLIINGDGKTIDEVNSDLAVGVVG